MAASPIPTALLPLQPEQSQKVRERASSESDHHTAPTLLLSCSPALVLVQFRMARQPFMYEPVRKDDDRFPQKPFDPKTVTRASWEPKKPKPKPSAPYVAINRHPEYVFRVLSRPSLISSCFSCAAPAFHSLHICK